MKAAILRAVILAAIVFLALFAIKMTVGDQQTALLTHGLHHMTSEFDVSRKNYASFKKELGAATQPLGDVQKYEKIATLSETTGDFDASRQKLNALIAASDALVQFERLTGLTGSRVLHLGVGAPPAKFDSFIEEAGKIAKLTGLTIIKNDKTNEYRELRAKRETLEKTRKALMELAGSGGSVDERLKVQAQLTDIEEKIQNLGVSLGDFDTQNEFCTVKLTLVETGVPVTASWSSRAFAALGWTIEYFALLAGGFLMLTIAFWVGAVAVAIAIRVTQALMKILEK